MGLIVSSFLYSHSIFPKVARSSSRPMPRSTVHFTFFSPSLIRDCIYDPSLYNPHPRIISGVQFISCVLPSFLFTSSTFPPQYGTGHPLTFHLPSLTFTARSRSTPPLPAYPLSTYNTLLWMCAVVGKYHVRFSSQKEVCALYVGGTAYRYKNSWTEQNTRTGFFSWGG